MVVPPVIVGIEVFVFDDGDGIIRGLVLIDNSLVDMHIRRIGKVLAGFLVLSIPCFGGSTGIVEVGSYRTMKSYFIGMDTIMIEKTIRGEKGKLCSRKNPPWDTSLRKLPKL